MSRTPTVDVIVPCYNYAGYLEQCIVSILEQPGVNVRVLVLDDASTDGTPEVGERLEAADSRVTCRRHAANRGHIATYNEGFEWVEADYLLLISADDLLTPSALTRAVGALEEHPRATMAHGRQIVFETEARPPAGGPLMSHGDYTVQSGTDFITELCRQGHNPVATPTVVVRTSTQHQVGGYDPSLPHTADLLNWLRLAARGDVIEIAADQAFKRMHQRNMQLQFTIAAEGDVLERARAFDRFWGCDGDRVIDAGQLKEIASTALAADLLWRATAAFEACDSAQCEALASLSRQMHPGIVRTKSWRRLSVKRTLGPRLWSRVAVCANALGA